MSKKIGLFPGSFDPVHLGHLQVAECACKEKQVEEVWFVFTPQNPFKQKTFFSEKERLDFLERVVSRRQNFALSKLECSLPKPTSTFETIRTFKKMHPENIFFLIVGEDLLLEIPLWKKSSFLAREIDFLVYRRNIKNVSRRFDKSFFKNKLTFLKSPPVDISSTMIRRCLFEKQSVEHFLPKGVFRHLEKIRNLK